MGLAPAVRACIVVSLVAVLPACGKPDAPLGSGPVGQEERLADAAFGALSRSAYHDAEQIALEAVRRQPDDPQALLALAIAYEALGKKDAAREQYRILESLRPEGAVVVGPGGPRLVADVAREGLQRLAPAPAGPGTVPGPDHAERRFLILRDLVGRGLVTEEEYQKRRAANLGALLPYSEAPAAAALDWPPPAADQFAERLRALARSLENRALTPREHAAERMAILEALLPTTPQARRAPPAPPASADAVAAEMARLQRLRAQGLITADEMARERAALDRLVPPPVASAPVEATPRPLATPSPSRPADKPVSAGAFGVHLSSLRSEAAARQGWEQLRKRHPGLLGQLSPTISRVEIKGKGTFYRLVAGPLPDRKAARALCAKLKAQKQFCVDMPLKR